MKSRKGLDAYIFFESGWVGNVLCHETQAGVLLSAKVMHSQRISEESLQPWVFAGKDGNILCAHCNCMAG